MKSFKETIRENLNEGQDRYPGDDMTQKELKIAINAAKNILDMIEDGSMLMRWQISAIVKASEELASVCTSMRADEEDEEWSEYDSPFSMYGEELDFKVSVDGLPDMYVKANSPSEVKANLRKVVKKPDSIRSVDRVTRNMVRKIFRDKAAGKEEIEESTVPTQLKKDLKHLGNYATHFYPTDKGYGIGFSTKVRKDELARLLNVKSYDIDDDTSPEAGSSKAPKFFYHIRESLNEGYNDSVHRKYISDAVHEYVSKDDPKHDKIVDHLHQAKNFGSKTADSLESHASISIGSAKRITKAVADHLKANFGSPSKTQTQAQRVDRYLKQKWVKPR